MDGKKVMVVDVIQLEFCDLVLGVLEIHIFEGTVYCRMHLDTCLANCKTIDQSIS